MKKKEESESCCGRQEQSSCGRFQSSPGCWSAINDQFPPDRPIVREAVVSEEARRRVEDEGTEVDDESEIISVGVGPLSIFGGCESEGVTFEEAVGKTSLISETKTA